MARDLDAAGNAILEALLSPDECRSLAGLYPVDDIFRSRIVMARHGFGRGEYKYFAYPLPDVVAALREVLYRVNMRHGVSRLRAGRRHTLGIIFHDAK
ncbi:MAG: 2OG-Fe(II) oxygenase [Burkholderiales bacterium]